MRRHKKGPSDWYKPLQAQKKPEAVEKPPDLLFRGFIGGDTFVTKKNYRGMKLDTQWARYVLDSFEKDDDELLKIALESCLADLSVVVTGGQHGSPLSIGQYGFFADNQIFNQASHLQQRARKLGSGKLFLSETEWGEVDNQLKRMVDHTDHVRFRQAVRGDSFASLAIRKNAFLCAKIIVDNAVDPMKVNEEGEDLFMIVAEQYAFLCEEMKRFQSLLEDDAHKVFTPTETKALKEREFDLIQSLTKMHAFVESLCANLTQRLIDIEKDKRSKKFADLRGETLAFEQRWNIEQEPKVLKHIEESKELRETIKMRLRAIDRQLQEHVSLSVVMSAQHDIITAKNASKEVHEVVSHVSQDVIKQRLNHLHRKTGSLTKRDIMKKLGMSSEETLNESKLLAETITEET